MLKFLAWANATRYEMRKVKIHQIGINSIATWYDIPGCFFVHEKGPVRGLHHCDACLRSGVMGRSLGLASTTFTAARSWGIALFCLEAGQAQDRTAALGLGARLERYLAGVSALCTSGGKHLAGLHALILALVSAVLAALRSGQAALGVEGLLSFGEGERCAAVAAR